MSSNVAINQHEERGRMLFIAIGNDVSATSRVETSDGSLARTPTFLHCLKLARFSIVIE